MRTWWVGWFGVLLVLALGHGVARGDTGGSMGGGDWSSSSRSSSSDYSSGGGGGGSYSYDSSYGSTGDGGSLPPALIIVILIIVVLWFVAEAARGQSGTRSYGDASYDAIDVSVLRIAIDGSARQFVQTGLARIAAAADTASAEGRLTMLREVDLLLRRARDAWVYGGAVNEPMRSMGAAKLVFDSHVTNARARFREEVVRNAQGVITTNAPTPVVPRPEEGPGLLLVSLIVAARSELFTVGHIEDGEDLRKALEAASYRPARDLVAIEVVWQPSEDADRLSSIELEARYPAPELLPIRGALVGKAFCRYCGGPYPAELVSCPHCGAPAAGLDSAAA